jgi:hypothetical protein
VAAASWKVQVLDDVESAVSELQFVSDFPKILLEYLRGDEQMSLAARTFRTGQIRLNMNQGKIESIEIRQFARNKKEGT